jgi:hypothetical protein
MARYSSPDHRHCIPETFAGSNSGHHHLVIPFAIWGNGKMESFRVVAAACLLKELDRYERMPGARSATAGVGAEDGSYTMLDCPGVARGHVVE